MGRKAAANFLLQLLPTEALLVGSASPTVTFVFTSISGDDICRLEADRQITEAELFVQAEESPECKPYLSVLGRATLNEFPLPMQLTTTSRVLAVDSAQVVVENDEDSEIQISVMLHAVPQTIGTEGATEFTPVFDKSKNRVQLKKFLESLLGVANRPDPTRGLMELLSDYSSDDSDDTDDSTRVSNTNAKGNYPFTNILFHTFPDGPTAIGRPGLEPTIGLERPRQQRTFFNFVVQQMLQSEEKEAEGVSRVLKALLDLLKAKVGFDDNAAEDGGLTGQHKLDLFVHYLNVPYFHFYTDSESHKYNHSTLPEDGMTVFQLGYATEAGRDMKKGTHSLEAVYFYNYSLRSFFTANGLTKVSKIVLHSASGYRWAEIRKQDPKREPFQNFTVLDTIFSAVSDRVNDFGRNLLGKSDRILSRFLMLLHVCPPSIQEILLSQVWDRFASLTFDKVTEFVRGKDPFAKNHLAKYKEMFTEMKDLWITKWETMSNRRGVRPPANKLAQIEQRAEMTKLGIGMLG